MKLSKLLPLSFAAMVSLASQNVIADTAPASATPPKNTADSLSDNQVNQVKGVVHDYLVTNPQVLVEASQSLQKQEMDKIADKAKAAIAANADGLFGNIASPVVGNANGDVTLIEFFDYQCPHCKEMKPIMDKVVADNANLRVVYKQLPIFGQTSHDAAAIALAAMKQGADKFLKLHNALLAAQGPLNKDKTLAIAKSLGLDTIKLVKDMVDPTIQKQIDDNLQLAQSLNLIGTPTFIIAKWKVDDKKNDVKNAVFMPGMPTADELKAKIVEAGK